MIKFLKVFLLSAFLLIMLAFTNIIYGQQGYIHGIVKDAYGELPGATIIVKGTTIGITTDVEGKFTLPLETSNAVLHVSYIGYQSVEVPVSITGGVVEIILEEDITAIDEVVVTAFATQKKVNVTGAISSVGGDALIATP